jgi:hypothetical protein
MGDDPRDRRVARDPAGRPRIDRFGVLQARTTADATLERVEVHRDRHVRALAADPGANRPVEPLPADLAERVGPPLRRRAAIIRRPRADLGVDDGTDRGDHGLTGLGVERPVDPDHPLEGGGEVEGASFARQLGVAQHCRAVQRLPPVGDRPPEVSFRERPRRLDEGRLRGCERVRVRLARMHEDPDGRAGQVAVSASGSRRGHLVQGGRLSELVGRARPSHAEPMREPGAGRQVPIALPGAPSLDLGESPEPFDLEHPPQPLELGEVVLERPVAHAIEILRRQLVEHRPDRAHGRPRAIDPVVVLRSTDPR